MHIQQNNSEEASIDVRKQQVFCLRTVVSPSDLIVASDARNGQSLIPKNPRGRPMTTDIGSWVIKDPDTYVTPPCALYLVFLTEIISHFLVSVNPLDLDPDQDQDHNSQIAIQHR